MATSSWDLFLSHASEDKAAVADPLAEELTRLGLAVWYDRFELKLGDSLSRSIDEGLAGAGRGLVVLSPDFFRKAWPEREYRGLIAREIAGGPSVIPIWHRVEFDAVVAFSPPIADVMAAKTSEQSIAQIAFDIANLVRPDLVSRLQRDQLLGRGTVESVDPRTLIPGPIRRRSLPRELMNRILIIHGVFQEVVPLPLSTTIDNFLRDLNPEHEVEVWESMASIYLMTSPRLRNFRDRKTLYAALLRWSMTGRPTAQDVRGLPVDIATEVITAATKLRARKIVIEPLEQTDATPASPDEDAMLE